MLFPLFKFRENRYFVGLTLSVVATCLYSLKGIVVKIMYQHDIDTVSVMALRIVFVLPIYIIIGAIVYRRTATEVKKLRGILWLQCLLIGIVGYYFSSYLDLKGLNYISAQLAGIVSFTYPVFIYLINRLFFKEILKTEMRWALLCSVIAMLILSTHEMALSRVSDNVIAGVLYTLAGALSFSVYMAFSRTFFSRMPVALFTCIAMGGASVCIFIHFLSNSGWASVHFTGIVVFLAFFMAVFSTVLPSFILSYAMKLIGSSKVAVMGAFGPVSTAVFSVLLLSEPFSIYHFLGMFFTVLSGFCLFIFADAKKPIKP